MTQLPSLERWALLPFWGFHTLTCFSCFSEPVILLRTCIIFLSQVLGLSLGIFFIFFRYFPVPYFGLACDHGNSFLCLEK